MPYANAKPNETLAEVVARAGPQYSLDEVKAHPKNQGLLKARSEYVLKEGDPVWIPEEETEQQWFTVTVGNQLTLTAGALRPFKLILRYPDRSIIKNEPFKLLIDGQTYEGTTSGEGLLDVQVPVNATRGVVSVKGHRQALEIGALEPVHTSKGIQARLRNLGYPVGPIDGQLGPKSTAAIRAFQQACGLPVTGKVGPATRDRLKAEHGC